MVDNDDEKIQLISKMLEIGGTMLAQHCDSCGAPMFRYKGDVRCPVCKETEDPRTRLQPRASSEAAPAIKSGGTPVTEHIVPHATQIPEITEESISAATVSKDISVSTEGLKTELESLLMEKMISLARSMQDENDNRRISDSLDIIEHSISIVKKMKRTF
ncbi:autoantigen p27 domain-containing protein [Methanolobus sp.]|uniref:autoantigen p27 domain-containing protein n=1 Tax=Methanolobus sp. TaxID=1874737 RepID=UPI0025D4836C|nr:autoantigen p27 domain-containing protein [Methanolobus sp.]